MAKVFIKPKDNGLNDVLVKRTRPKEGRNVTAKDVRDEDLEATVARMLATIRGEDMFAPA